MAIRSSLAAGALALGAAAFAPVASAQPSSRAAGAVASVAAVVEGRVVDLAREWFPQTRGWFRLVAGARFAPSADGRLVPDYASLTHPRVRAADNAGYTIVPRYPPRYDGWLRVASGQHPDAYVELSPAGSRPSRAEQQDGVLVYPDAYVDTDVLYKSTPTHADEYLLLRSRAAPSRWVFRVRRGPRVAALRQAGNSLEAVDARGRAWLRASRPVAVDRQGRRATGEIVVRGDEVTVRIDLSALEPPVLVDPDWSSTADMAFGRFYAGANVLPSGRVLATGGCSASVCSGDLGLPACRTVLREAEALDLDTRTWSRAGDDAEARFFHTAESLASGAVLIAGGCVDPSCSAATASVRVYDPARSAFDAVGSLAEPRAAIASVRLRDGRVLLAGGCAGSGCTTRAEIYDPASRALRPAARMFVARGRAEAVLLDDGRVLVVGGCGAIACATTLASAEVYDPATDRWFATAPMATARGGHFAVGLDDGRVLVGGGCADAGCGTFLRSTEVFVPSGARFVAGPAMTQSRLGARAVRLLDGRVLVNQGCSGRTECDLSNEVFDPRASSFARIEDAVTTRAFHNLVHHERARVAVAIGGCQPRTCSWWNETYDLSQVRPPVDAGVDAGPGDSGVTTDVAVPMDGGTDAGPADVGRPDGGAADAGRTDAPTVSPPPAGRGACDCRAGAGASPRGSRWLSAALLMALAVAARGRGRGR